MRYALIIPDGAADEPIGELGNRTPLEAARHLMTLSNVSLPQHAARRADDVRRALNLPGLKRNDENL